MADKKVFTKDQILASKRFENRRDIVNALLESDKTYELKAVDTMINKFMKGKVK